MKSKVKKNLVTLSVIFSLTIFALAFTPHFTCACGQYEDGSYLTHFINSVSEKVVGKPVIEKNEKPFH